MPEYLKNFEQNGIETENVDGAEFNSFTARYKDGIVKGVLNECALTSVSNNLMLDTGLMLVKGFRIKIVSQAIFTLNGIPSVNTEYQLYAKITLAEDRSVVTEINIRPKQDLIQQDLFKNELGVYEVEIATFNHNTSGVIDNLIPTLEVLTENGSGTNIEIDSELSLESENAVQNKVITQTLNDNYATKEELDGKLANIKFTISDDGNGNVTIANVTSFKTAEEGAY